MNMSYSLTCSTSQPVGNAVGSFSFSWHRKHNASPTAKCPSDPCTFPADLPVSIWVSLLEEGFGLGYGQVPRSFGEILQEQSGDTTVREHQQQQNKMHLMQTHNARTRRVHIQTRDIYLKLNCSSSCSMKPLLSWSKILKTLSMSAGLFLDNPTVLKNIFGLNESFAESESTDKTWLDPVNWKVWTVGIPPQVSF